MKSAIIICLFIGAALAAYDEHTIMFQRDGTPYASGWSLLRRAEPERTTKFTITLPQQNLHILEERFWAVSNPRHPDFAKHLSKDAIRELVAAEPKVQKSVLRWIHHIASTMPAGNLLEVENTGDAIEVKSTCKFAEALFHTEMFLFYNEKSNEIVSKHMGPLSVPSELESSIVFVSGITELHPVKSTAFLKNQPHIQKKLNQKKQTPDNQCNNPYTIKNLYNVPQNLFVTNKMANASIYAEPSAGVGEGFGLGSIEDYQHSLGLPLNPIKCILGNGEGFYVVNDTDLEANLDTEMMTGMAPNVDVCFYIMESGNGWMYEFSREVMATPNAPLVVSMSYGWNEDDSCINASSPIGYGFLGNCSFYHIPSSKVYINLTNINFMKLGVAGHSLIAASGDAGTAGTHGSLNNCETMGPIFPAASPYVLTVGATSIEVTPASRRPQAGAPALCTDSFYECECSTSTNEQPALANDTAGFDTGGGFSVYSPMPSYQVSAVQAYLKSGVLLPPAMYFNPSNRGFPDVAGVGDAVCLLDPGQPCDFVGGTSASTPLWGAIITLLNNDRITAGKDPLGFVNQIIYDMFDTDAEKYFNTQFPYGNNPGGCPTNMGFNAKSGFWTPLTGCGSPNFQTIREYVAALN